ncbi:M50 family metallopeptidase [Bacillus sp. ISL-35]|uniref:M50 family metallopeptidase n=1 Tax=Bacillus sp. ISL-35 TaxID=2819122 RepID=UPI001BE8E9BE|nr:M50 family metallopeptidase [Bacillus sp. ISL-35]MBT2681668.1 M50 family metallopeptidase [Bacillus sp. ISL-35]MBT2702296.1 M50 family metallopeptidase [Chryseobacterium sp. ISL-80]
MNKIFELLRKIQIHPLLWVVIALAVATAHFIELMMVLLIIFVHEMGHGAAASFFSWRIKKIALLPFGGVAEVDEHGNRPLKEELIVVLAGPLQHIWMMGLAYLLFIAGVFPEKWHSLFMEYNLMILMFNLIPIWPLDGGKLLFILLSMNTSFQEAHLRTLYASVGALLIFSASLLFIAPLTLNVWVIIGFLAFSLYFEWKQRRFTFMRFLMERHYGKQVDLRELKPINTSENEMVGHVLERFQRGCKHPIIVKQQNGKEMVIDENELLHAFFSEKLLTAKIGDLLYTY